MTLLGTETNHIVGRLFYNTKKTPQYEIYYAYDPW